MTDTPISLDKAITQGLSEVTRERTLSTHAQQMGSGNPKIINFRGDIAANYQYDKIKPLSSKAQAMGNVVIIQGESQKNRTNRALPNFGQSMGLARSLGAAWTKAAHSCLPAAHFSLRAGCAARLPKRWN